MPEDTAGGRFSRKGPAEPDALYDDEGIGVKEVEDEREARMRIGPGGGGDEKKASPEEALRGLLARGSIGWGRV